jgi:hypothetical protein
MLLKKAILYLGMYSRVSMETVFFFSDFMNKVREPDLEGLKAVLKKVLLEAGVESARG